jgi:hypothetical protein
VVNTSRFWFLSNRQDTSSLDLATEAKIKTLNKLGSNRKGRNFTIIAPIQSSVFHQINRTVWGSAMAKELVDLKLDSTVLLVALYKSITSNLSCYSHD